MSINILQEQINYYRDRAAEYDEWFFRQGRYDRGEAHRQQWFAEIAEVESALFATNPSGFADFWQYIKFSQKISFTLY